MKLVDDETRFLRHVTKTEGCWVWTGYTSQTGYGSFGVGSRADGSARVVRAHRWAYENWRGPIPAGLTVDHLCTVRNCVRPDHLEAVTQGVNSGRGDAKSSINRDKTHCDAGHEFTPENTYVGRGKYGQRRVCRVCRSAYQQRYKQKLRERRGES